ncbi:uncharacterized protein [Pocillopora verrucosa]|uniref:uncharacterized protein n=1 Tax=Pocillopora verrucosa TaxID=203993 RepID=UPI00333F822D
MFLLILRIFVISEAFTLLRGVPIFEPVGCYLDSGISPRPMPLLLKDFRPEMNWNNIEAVIKQCASLAYNRSLSYFGLRYYGQCWSGATADQTYSRDGPDKRCVRGVGLESTYFVYKFYDYSHQVPGCNMVWKAQDNFCFLVSVNYSSTENKMKEYCQKNEGDLYYATNKSAFRLLEQFLYTIVSSANGGKSSQCIVVGLLNASSFSKLPLTQQNKSNSMTHICATRLPSQWKLQGCLVNSCDHLCIAPRDISPVSGTFIQHATDAAFTGHMITSLLVDDVAVCARECLLYRNCVSFNFEYLPTGGRELMSSGRVCELNDEIRDNCWAKFHRRNNYKYYERLQL